MRNLISILAFTIAFVIGCFFVWIVFSPTPQIAEIPALPQVDNLPPVLEEQAPIIAEYDGSRAATGNLVWTSLFHSEDFPYKNNERWMGLFKDGDKFVVRSTRLRVKKIANPDLYDLEVTATRKGDAVFLFRDLPNIKESVIPTAFLVNDDADEILKPGTRELNFNGIHYALILENPTSDEYPGKGSTLTLVADGKEQTLRYLPDGCNDCSWTLLWAGDLDADGNLDLLMDLADHYNVEDRVLFLSSKADADKLVKFSANFYSYGC